MPLGFLDQAWLAELDQLERAGLMRQLPTLQSPPSRSIVIHGRSAINFSSNNYLGLAAHPALLQASSDAAHTFGLGATASRLIAGSLPPHVRLEASLATWNDASAVLLFNSGYHANI